MTRLNVAEGPKPSVEEGIALLKAVLAFQINDPLILSAVLSCVSALFPYIQDAPDTLPTVLDKVNGVIGSDISLGAILQQRSTDIMASIRSSVGCNYSSMPEVQQWFR